MSRWIVTLGTLWLVFGTAAAAAQAEDYRSGFGFGISVPEPWLVLTRDEVLRHADALLHSHSHSKVEAPTGRDTDPLGGSTRAVAVESDLQAIPAPMVLAVFEQIRSGELEVFYRRESVFGSFVDNVNIMTQPAPLPATREELAGVCEELPLEFSRVFGRPISMDACEMRERIGRPALYLEFDGAVQGTTTMQYQVGRGEDSTLVFTATADRPNLARLMGEFEEMVSSVRLP